MIDKTERSDAREIGGASVCKDQRAGMASDEISIAAAKLSDGSRRAGAAGRMQLKIANKLGLPPASLSESSQHATPRMLNENGTPDTCPGQVPEAECLALVRAFTRIRDPEVRHSLLQMVEAAATGA